MTELMKSKIATALAGYVATGYDINHGFNIIRYAKAGYLEATVDATQLYLEQSPLPAEYITLRLARAGHLKLKAEFE